MIRLSESFVINEQVSKKCFKLLSPSGIFDFHQKLITRHGGAIGNYPDSLGRAESIKKLLPELAK